MKKNIVFIAGGSAVNGISQQLLKQGHQVTILVNAYDDGKSTGIIRRDFGILGPSDIAKNLVSMIDDKRDDFNNLKNLMNYRFDDNYTLSDLINTIQVSGSFLGGIQKNTANVLLNYIQEFIKQAKNHCSQTKKSDYLLNDFAMRNIIFTGCYFKNLDYAKTIKELQTVLSVRGNIVLNSYDNLFLVGISSSGRILHSEAEIVNSFLDEHILEVYSLDHYLSQKQSKKLISLKDTKKRMDFLNLLQKRPTISIEAKNTLRNADIICIGPSTLESSITPTLMTNSLVTELIKCSAKKIITANLLQERGILPLSTYLSRIDEVCKKQISNSKYISEWVDAVIVNSHGYQTGREKKKLIPIDEWQIKRMGLTLVKGNISTKNEITNELVHNTELLSQLIINSKKKTSKIKTFNKIQSLFSNPITTLSNKNAVINILDKANKSDFKSIKKTNIRVIIAAAGKQTRFKKTIPKSLYSIQGKPALIKLAEKAALIDQNFIIVTSAQFVTAIELAIKPHFPNCKILITDSPGTAFTIKSAEQLLGEKDSYLLVIWADTPNISTQLMNVLSKTGALTKADAIIASSWESNPYAGIERDYYGSVVGLFQTKDNPEKKRSFGEHDASLFFLKRNTVFPFIEKSLSQVPIENDLNKIISRMCSLKEFTIIAAPIASPKETVSFNTIEEAIAINQKKNPTQSVNLEKDIHLGGVPTNYETEIKRFYKAVVFDFENTIAKDDQPISSELLGIILNLTSRKIPVGIITAGSLTSLQKRFIKQIDQVSSAAQKNYIYLYFANGAAGFQLSKRNTFFIDESIPLFISQTMIEILANQILNHDDGYKVDQFKTTIWRYNTDLNADVIKINELLKNNQLPLVAKIGNNSPDDSAIIITSDRISKRTALDDFAVRTNKEIDSIVKIGDMCAPGQVDYDLMTGNGSFCVGDHVRSNNIISVSDIYKCDRVKATIQLMNCLSID